MAKKILVKHLRLVYDGQQTSKSIEDSTTFVTLIARKRSPGIPLARKKGISYFVSKGDDILKIDADKKTKIGRIAKPDVKVEQLEYSINK